MDPNSLLDSLTQIKQILVVRTTKKEFPNDYDEQYLSLRKRLIQDPVVRERLPEIVINNRTLAECWQFVRPKLSSYDERRSYLRDQFAPVLLAVETGKIAWSSESINAGFDLNRLEVEHVRSCWEKAAGRVSVDPSGAITSARSLVEATCKLILESKGYVPSEDGDLTRTYKAAAKSLNLSADQHSEQVFKKILSGCFSVVDGLAELRNKFGDAHAQGLNPRKPAARHAMLAVHLAGTMATFLAQTYEAQNGNLPGASVKAAL